MVDYCRVLSVGLKSTPEGDKVECLSLRPIGFLANIQRLVVEDARLVPEDVEKKEHFGPIRKATPIPLPVSSPATVLWPQASSPLETIMGNSPIL